MSLITSLRSHKTSCDYLCDARRPPSITMPFCWHCYSVVIVAIVTIETNNCEISPLKWCCIFCNRRFLCDVRILCVFKTIIFLLFNFIYDFPFDLQCFFFYFVVSTSLQFQQSYYQRDISVFLRSTFVT